MDIAAAKCDTSGSDSWNCSTPCTICRELKQTEQPAPTPQLQLAILAARLTTKIADNDALFRCNAELAQTNLKLQNEVSELREQMAKYITSVNNVDTAATNQQPKQPSNQSLEQKAMHIEKKEWTPDADFDAKLVSNWKFEDAYQQSSLDQQITDFLMKDEINTRSLRKLEPQEQDKESLKKKLNASRKFEEKNEKMENNAGRLGKCLEASGEYCLKHENGMEEVEDGLEIRQYEDAKHQQKLKKTFEDKKLKVSRIDSEEFLSLKSQNVHMGNSDQESKRLREELHSTKMPYENERVHRKLFQVGFTKRSEEQKKAVKTKLEDEGDWISDSAPEHFQTLLEEQVQDIARGSSVEEGRMKLLQELEEQLQQKEIEMQELEKRNRSLSQQLKSQQRLIEGLEKKLDVTEEYSMTLEEKNVSMEQEITDQKKKYKELMMEKVRLRDEVENEVTAKLHVEIMLLKQENESLIVELAKKQTSLDEEKAKMKTRLVNLEYRAVNREIDLEKSKTKPKHTQEEKIQMERQLDGNGTQMNELQGKNEVDQEFHQQLVEAQRKITELKRKLDQVIEQNGLLKNGEQKLMDALVISNKQLAETESKNERLESEISNLQASLLKAGEMAKKTDHSVKLMQDDPNAMIEIHAKAGTSSASIQSLDNPVTIERYCPVQEKVDELKEEFNEASSDNILVKKIQFSALEKKTPLSAELRTYPVRSSVSTPSPFEISFPELNETESNLSSKSSQKKVSTFDNPSESPLQKTTHYFPQNEDKLRRRKGGGGGFQGAEKI
ncbi:unnamed protein product [Cercopithifilaria johnstoni]|uniref:Uncharacterized protein n=1 Tax=Cercopithifilaria johnstoni TaxID=2874296 RepID=A0A8J2QAN4_9BILA|nr:unnamed protein product [Cercopithifilaria johnstoni]